MGRRSGRARYARRPLTVDRVIEELGPLETHEDASRWLQKILHWGVAGLLKSTSGCVRAVEVWLQVMDAKVSFDQIEALRASVRELGAERDRLDRENEQLRLERRSV